MDRSKRIALGVLATLIVPLGSAGGASAATVSAQVTANNVKPLVISKIQDFDLGSITLGTGVWSNATVSLSQAGALSCANANVTCSGATAVAQPRNALASLFSPASTRAVAMGARSSESVMPPS